jgi:hypothetical protein
MNSDRVGSVTKLLISNETVPSSILVMSGSGKLLTESDLVIITGLSLDMTANAQFTPTLGDRIYLYAYGDQMSNAIVSGVVFSTDCGNSNTNGVLPLVRFFNDYKVSNANQTDGIPVVKLQIGSNITIVGYLISCAIQYQDTLHRIVNFTLTLKALPSGGNI